MPVRAPRPCAYPGCSAVAVAIGSTIWNGRAQCGESARWQASRFFTNKARRTGQRWAWNLTGRLFNSTLDTR